jgi:hypothetical protein
VEGVVVVREGAISKAVETAVRALGQRLAGDPAVGLVGVALYGSAARGEWVPGISDTNVLIVPGRGDEPALGAIAAALAAAPLSARVTPFVLPAEELQQSADTFCVKLDDIQRHHVLVAGRDPLAGLVIDPTHLRFLVEFSLRDAALRLRLLRLRAAEIDERQMVRLVVGTLTPLRCLCRLLGAAVPTATSAFFDAIPGVLGLDPAPLRALWTTSHRGIGHARPEREALARELAEFFKAAVQTVDRLG